ncbi:MAG: sugar MFS transporter [Flavobacteriales bacterium]|nr:sugar MFS transporter [Flavobacteriales bacterium]
MVTKQGFKKAFIVITSLFFMWGLITVLVDSLIPRLKEIFEIDNTQAVLVQFAFFGAYGLLSIPAGNLLHKIGYKRGIMLGLGIMGLGSLLFLPAASMRLFPLFMLGYFILAAGMVILQVAANPYVTALGDERTASSRLNLSQAFNSLGTTIAPILGAIFILSDDIKSSEEIKALNDTAKEIYFSAEAAAVQMPFLILAISLLVLTGIVFRAKLPQLLNTAIHSNYGQALKHTRLSLGAIGIFFYVGAEVAIGSFLVNYFLDMELADVIRNNSFMASVASLFHGDDLALVDDKGIVGSFNVLYWGGAMIGRFAGSYLTKVYQPQKVLSFFAVAAILLIVLSMSTNGLVALWAVLAVGLFNSIMFPTIFSLAIEGLGELKPQGSGLLCTAIVGGAFVPLVFGYLSVEAGFKVAFISTILCYAYIFFYSWKVKTSLT